MKTIGRELGQLAFKASMAHLDDEEGAIELAWVLAAAHSAFFNGGSLKMRKLLADNARRCLSPIVHKDDEGFATYSGGGIVVPLTVGAKRIHRARYIRARLQGLLEEGASEERLLNNLVGLVGNVWPVPRARAKQIEKDRRVTRALEENRGAEAILGAALRAAGVRVPKDLFAADDKRVKRKFGQ